MGQRYSGRRSGTPTQLRNTICCCTTARRRGFQHTGAKCTQVQHGSIAQQCAAGALRLCFSSNLRSVHVHRTTAAVHGSAPLAPWSAAAQPQTDSMFVHFTQNRFGIAQQTERTSGALERSSATMDMTNPGVQKPHWLPCALASRSCMGGKKSRWQGMG